MRGDSWPIVIYVAAGLAVRDVCRGWGVGFVGGGEMDPRGDRRRQSDYSLPASFIFIFNTRRLHLFRSFFPSPDAVATNLPTSR